MTDLASWEQRYATGDHAGAEPDPFLVRCSEYLDEFLPARGRALDLAGGAGRNAVHLASLGFDVTLVDFSPTALAKATELAASRGLRERVTIETADFERGDWMPPPESYDLVTVFFFLQRILFPVIRQALKPGGLLVYRTYTVDQQRFAGRPRHPMYLLTQNELLNAFRDFRVLFYEETMREKATASLVALKRGLRPEA